jgi:hypothetical protein
MPFFRPGVGASALPTISGSRASPNSITAAGGITFSGTDAFNMQYIQGNTANTDVNVTAVPQITAATLQGQRLILIGRSDTQRVVLDDGDGLSLIGSCTIGEDNVLELFWDGTNWVEIGRNF